MVSHPTGQYPQAASRLIGQSPRVASHPTGQSPGKNKNLLKKELEPRSQQLDTLQAISILEHGEMTLRKLVRETKRLAKLAFKGEEKVVVECQVIQAFLKMLLRNIQRGGVEGAG